MEDYSADGSSFFVGPNDWAFIQGVNRELIDEVIDTSIILYQVLPQQTYTDLYGDAPDGKVYKTPLSIEVLIKPQEQQTQRQNAGGPEKTQTLEFSVQREVLKELDVYPQAGDIVQWSNLYYEIKNTTDNKLLAGKSYYRHGVTATAESTRISKINIVNPDQHE